MFGFGEAIKKTKPPQDSLQAEYCSYYSPMDITSTCVEIQESGRPAVLNYCLKSDDWTITFQEKGFSKWSIKKKHTQRCCGESHHNLQMSGYGNSLTPQIVIDVHH